MHPMEFKKEKVGTGRFSHLILENSEVLVDVGFDENLRLKEILNENYLILDTRQSDLRLYRGKVPTLRTGRHGILYVKDGENKFVVGKLQTAGFTNEQGLVSQGNNLYEISNETGNIYNAVNLNKLVGSSLEQSKASIANSLTALLIYQKAFEANSKSITTSDDMLQTAIQLKK
jgi:flagellar hook protein FlgE